MGPGSPDNRPLGTSLEPSFRDTTMYVSGNVNIREKPYQFLSCLGSPSELSAMVTQYTHSVPVLQDWR